MHPNEPNVEDLAPCPTADAAENSPIGVANEGGQAVHAGDARLRRVESVQPGLHSPNILVVWLMLQGEPI